MQAVEMRVWSRVTKNFPVYIIGKLRLEYNNGM